MKLLFLGDSLIEFYDWRTRFSSHTVINAGQAGETVAGLLASLPRLLDQCPDPDRVFIMIGTNNLLMEDYAFLPDYEKILAGLTTIITPERITITGLPPFVADHLAPSAIPRMNAGLHQLSLAKKTTFLDLYSAFSTDAQTVAACFADDGVHLSDLGYAIWSARLADNL
jgi:lysophospholipase L1-like esterase